MRWFLEKINKIGKFVDKFTKINTKRHKLVKLEMFGKETLEQIPMKFGKKNKNMFLKPPLH